MQIKLNDKLFDLSIPVVMGIVNATPDSFYPGSRYTSDKSLLSGVEKMLMDDVDIVDVGGYSTRPKAENISSDEEIGRLANAIENILKKFPDTIISVDTFRANVARYMVQNYNVAIINDIGGGTLDDLMFETIADLQVAYVLMHTKGTPQTMQNQTNYENVVAEVLHFLQKRIAQLHLLGVNDIIADPGFGFAKTIEQNYSLLSKLSYFKELNVPLLAGVSRKSMICKVLDIETKDALNGTTSANMLALLGGASILRVHDVKEAKQTISVFQKYQKGLA
ncbi:MAG: dihydropteroate synthase [Bacteroidales bacterium]|nr:dihydropteroate synthase [Bacteroidales bacterium]